MLSHSGPAFRVVFVSTRNATCAATAERLMRPALAAAGIEAWAIRITSAGLVDEDGGRMDAASEAALRALGGNPGGFRSRLLEHDVVDDSDLILTMTRDERDSVIEAHPRALRRTFTLVEFAQLTALADPIAPLREHPLMLAGARFQLDLTDADDVRDSAGDDPREHLAIVEAIAATVRELASAWIAMAPVRAPHRDPLGALALMDAGADPVVVCIEAFGVPIDVRCTGDGARALAKALRRAWTRCLRDPATPADPLVVEAIVHDDSTQLQVARARGAVGAETIADVMHSLTGTITVRAIDAKAGTVIMLHAAGLALPDGRVVAFVAPSGTGKTTLARALGRQFGYVSDETVVIGLDGTVTAYPKPLSFLPADAHTKEQLGPDEEALVRAPDDLRLARIVLLNRDASIGDTPEVEDVPLLEGITELAVQVSYLPRLDEPLRSLARTIERTGGLQRVTYTESSAIAPLLVEFARGGA